MSLLIIFDSKIIQIRLKPILSGEAGVHEEAFFVIPLFEAAVVKQFQVVLNDKRYNVVFQALFEKDQAAYTAISVLEGMDAFKSYMDGYNVLKGLRGQCIVARQQLADLTGNIFRECGIITAHLVGKFLVLPYCKPILAAIAGAGLQYKM